MIEFLAQDGASGQPWFDPNTFGALYGGLVGGLGGGLGGCLGAAAGYFAPRGKYRGLVLGGFWLFVVLGAIHLAAAVVALATGQPPAIYGALSLVGVLFSVIFGSLLPVVRRRYAEAEQRRMHAAGLRAS